MLPGRAFLLRIGILEAAGQNRQDIDGGVKFLTRLDKLLTGFLGDAAIVLLEAPG